MVVNAPTSNIVSAAELADRPAARHRAQHRGRRRRPQGRAVEAQPVHRRRAVREDGRRRRPGPDRRPGRRNGCRRSAWTSWPSTPTSRRPAPPRWACGWSASTSCSRVSDFITVHLPKTPETVGLIGDEALRQVKPTVRIVNAARGGIVDEHALAAALKEGRVAGAGHRRLRHRADAPSRRCSSSSRWSSRRTWAPPPTRPRRRPASRSPGRCGWRWPASSCPDAVNVAGGVIAEEVRPGIPLAEKLGRIFTALAGALPTTAGRRGARRDHPARRRRARAGRAQGRVPRRRRGAGVLRQRAGAGRRARRRRSGW